LGCPREEGPPAHVGPHRETRVWSRAGEECMAQSLHCVLQGKEDTRKVEHQQNLRIG